MPRKPFQNSSFSASTRVSCERVLDLVSKTYQNSSFCTRAFEVYFLFDPVLFMFLLLGCVFFDPFFIFIFIFDPAALEHLYTSPKPSKSRLPSRQGVRKETWTMLA